LIEILSSGPLGSIQDLGRTGYRNLGVGSAGAMDARALRIGNLLVGNPEGHAGIEFTLGGFSVRFESDTVFSLTGADVSATLDGEPVPPWWVRRARAGQVLKAGMARHGMRTMLCVAGGIGVATVLGSRSTDMKGGFGGHEGRSLKAGDRLAVGPDALCDMPERGFGLDIWRLGLVALPGAETSIRFLPAAEWPSLSPAVQERFLSGSWKLRPDSNRMGYRFQGEALQFERPLELFSHGIVPGTIQLPPEGQPVIQLNDANTSGGYPKLGVVIAEDLPVLAQVPLGTSVRFEAVTRDVALNAMRQNEAILDALPDRIELARDYAKRWGRK